MRGWMRGPVQKSYPRISRHAPVGCSWLMLGALSVTQASCSQEQVIKIDEGDTFTQEAGHVVTDLLWVIDSSGTMSEEQLALQNSLPGLIDRLLKEDLDFHLGVISTDAGDAEDAGVLKGDIPILTRETPDLRTTFAQNADVGIGGDRDEAGFAATSLALSLTDPGLPNYGFLRPDAELAVMFVSDEDDQSDSTVGGFIQSLQTLKGLKRVSLHALVGDVPMGCSSSTGAADAGSRYYQAVDATSGTSASICGSLGPWLDDLVQSLAHVQDTFPLSRVPDPSTIEVRVDGVLLHERDVDGWTYLPDLNAVRIQGTPLPEAGQTIAILYDPFRT